ncbi:hypothetical protein L7F22_010315 [Adiantum nelumboides]|nr:hypothetical protein [Adiantum nelumboides]
MAMKVRQDWETGSLELRPNHKVGGKQQKIVYNMKQGRQQELVMETFVDELSTSNCSLSKDESSEEGASSLEVMGIVLQDSEGEGGQDSLLLLKEVKRLLRAGFIYPVEDFEWVSPVVVTPKKNGKWRVCVDYKPLNVATKRDHFPLPFQDEILNEVAGHERYKVCDEYSSYFQIKIADEDQRKTTFITPRGCFAYRVMSFGLTNAPATFQSFMNLVFQPYFGRSIRVLIDNFCIYSSREVHMSKVDEGFTRLAQLVG